MTIKDTLKEVKDAGHKDIIVLGLGTEGKEHTLNFYTTNLDFNWVTLQMSRAQFNLLASNFNEQQEVEVEVDAA